VARLIGDEDRTDPRRDGLDGLEKRERAIEELRSKGLAD
jgi:hypothetical protein